jgi:hypothetical protein
VVAAAEIAQRNQWPDLVTRAATAYTALNTPGAVDLTGMNLALAALDLGADEADRPMLWAVVGYQQVVVGSFDEGSALLDEAVVAAAAHGGRALAVTRVFRAFADWGVPDRERPQENSDGAVAAAESLGAANWITNARAACAYFGMCDGERAVLERERAAIAALRDGQWERMPAVVVIDGALALLDGRFADAERLALEGLGTVDPASGTHLNFTAQLAAILYWSGRDDELLAALEAFPTDAAPQKYVLDCVRISTRARRGERDEQLAELAAAGFSSLPKGFHRPGSLCHAGSAAAWLGDRDVAAQLVPMLEPYAGRLLVAPFACLVFDAADSVRGMLLMVLGRVDEAIVCFEAAAELCDRGHDAPHGVMNAHRLAGALARRGGAEDVVRARALAASARDRATELGQAPDVRFAQAVLDAL